ncbi:hypothetical protein THIARS_50260 [Thiomonas delicata]|uniref:Uncharacterized protein n=1 Tax=Thiomonas delicata TaxID=364030 RepID=A0A238D184_THIDL|nr:hypothetical protein THIARS_50260 [Thiomonas delicata]
MADHMRIQVAALAGIDLHAGHTGRTDALSVERGFLVTLDHRETELAAQVGEGAGEQRGLSGPRAGDEIQSEDAALLEQPSVVAGVAVVLAQNVLLDLHHARLAQPRRVGASGAVAVVVVGSARHPLDRVGVVMMVLGMIVRMVVIVAMAVVIVMMMRVMHSTGAGEGLTADPGFALGTTANGTHISRPPVP